MKLLVAEQGTDVAHAAIAEANLLSISNLGYVETHSALARMRAGRRLTSADHRAAVRDFAELWGAMAVVDVSDAVVARAAELAQAHALRAYDAVHLSSALDISLDEQVLFACWDDELRSAARAQGLDLVPR